MIARLRNDPIPLRRRRADLTFSEAVERVLSRGMQRSPDDRYQTTLEFSEAFSAAAGGMPERAGDSRILGKLFGR
jgi:hypothetical protein